MMESKILNRITYLVERSLQEKITEEERSELFYYLVQDQYRELFDELFYQALFDDIVLEDIEESQQQHIFESILGVDKRIKVKNVHFNFWKWGSVAAVFLMVLGFMLFYFSEKPIENNNIQSQSNITQEILNNNENNSIQKNIEPLPANDQALFTTSDGISLRLDDLNIGEKKIIDDIIIQKTNLGEVLFLSRQDLDSRKSQDKLYTIVTPRGSKYKIRLPDETVVELNSSSKLIFPTIFSATERKVSLEGEGFFDVKSDKLKKFIVHVRGKKIQQDVVVYGTQFNINAYPETENIVTTLIEGAVKVRSQENETELLPLQQCVLSSESIVVSRANVDINLAWKNNFFYFSNETIENVMNEISRWYDVDIVYTENPPNIKVWGQISRTKSLDEILDILAKANDITFRMKGKEVVVMK